MPAKKYIITLTKKEQVNYVIKKLIKSIGDLLPMTRGLNLNAFIHYLNSVWILAEEKRYA